MRKDECPAWGKTCDNCQGRNHFRIKCKKVHLLGAVGGDSSDSDDLWLNTVINPSNKRTVTAVMEVNDCKIRFQLDSGADVNTICKKYVRREQVRESSSKLRMFNDTIFSPMGETDLTVINPKSGEEHQVTFVVVPNKYNCLLGLKTIQQLGLITVNNEKFIAKVESLSTLGDLGEASLTVDPNVKPTILPCRKLPIALKDRVKADLDNLVDRGVLVPVTKPTDWVSQMAVVKKPNGKLRICIDPQGLNSALSREHYTLPTLDDVLPKLQNARIFSKLDVKEAFWHVRLDEKSSELTTMITPFGRYRWARLPFGLKVSSEIFQRKLNEALEGLEGTFTIADDIIIAGQGSNDGEARHDNEKKLQRLYNRCEERNVVLNNDKKEIGLKEITFHGHTITTEGVKADPKKISAILKMSSPTDAAGVKRFCGMVQYMARFLPGLSMMLEPMRALTRNDTDFNWSLECEQAFQAVKEKLTSTPVLSYFNPKKELWLQVDSSKDGLGAVLLQDKKPIEYASRALNASERKWAQIEKEALAVLYGAERFDQYTYGRKIIVQNDHKPLEAILRKPLSKAPRRLQDIMMKLLRYDIEFRFLKGEKLVIADTLSRAYVADPAKDRSRVMCVNEDLSDSRLKEIREETLNDQALQALIENIQVGWPENKKDVEDLCKPYFDIRDTLSVYEGIIVRGEAIVIPKSLRHVVKQRLHSSHSGYDSMLRRARGTVYWPNMNSDLKQLAESCEACQELKPRTQKSLLNQHDFGHTPWQKIGLDLFEIKERHYLVSIDYYSNFIEVDLLNKTTSNTVIGILKKQFARFGIPSTIVSDGGPQFTSSEFKTFTEKWKITHVTSSPHHQRANGKAESAVKVMKNLMIKCERDRQDQFEALMEQRNTPRQDTGLSPNQMMFGRQTRTLIPAFPKEKGEINVKRQRRKKTVKRYHDRTARDLPKLTCGQDVYFEHKPAEKWILGKVVETLSEHTYVVQSQNGATYRRNRIHIRPTKIKAVIRDQSPPRYSVCIPQETPKMDIPRTENTSSEKSKSKYNTTMCDHNQSDVTASKTIPNTPVTPPKDMSGQQVTNRRPVRQRKESVLLKDFVRY